MPAGLHPGWNEFDPGGDTLCARGGPYAYWVRPGTVNKVVIEFEGGGACWNELTCSAEGSVFQDSVEGVRKAVAANYSAGIYDDAKAQNPFENWYHVIVPYCTGDLHWGHAVATYEKGTAREFTIHHQGAVNARAVLKWVYDSFSRPEQIFVTGCSAGSYGSALWSADVMKHYPQSRVFQLGDSGAGIITEQHGHSDKTAHVTDFPRQKRHRRLSLGLSKAPREDRWRGRSLSRSVQRCASSFLRPG